MTLSRLIALVLTALLSAASFAGTIGSSTGPTNPVEKPRAPAIQSAPGMNTDGTTIDHNLPPATGTDPRVQGNDAGRQSGTNLPDKKTPGSGGLGSSTTEDEESNLSQ
ncbi:hypothetical protein PS726_02332 [Pseudomonas fluorescens]|uniref:hypothetical protein n=1 Tax=Pseudomonas TaxID=286 RepID=UPI00124061E8|nr:MULTISPECIES: hypothetical protein [Pseudomonas]VVN96984.1 hypothetical protein PS726_02332 [Pseudomonas fluorescens]